MGDGPRCYTCFDYGSYNCPTHGPHPDVKHKIAMLEAKVKQLEEQLQRLVVVSKAEA